MNKRPLFKIEEFGDQIGVTSPYNEKFIRAARKLGGRWSQRERCWLFRKDARDAVDALLFDVYAWAPNEATRTIRLRAPERIDVYKDAVWVFGRMVARAMNDFEAKIGDRDGVRLIDGQILRGGSVDNWRTDVRPGATIEIDDVSARAIDEALSGEGRWGDTMQGWVLVTDTSE